MGYGLGKDRWIFANPYPITLSFRRGARVAEWGGLENRCGGNFTGGSNPSLSAIKQVRSKK